ncbi:hypothetical protein NDU88_003055 [Pleurodeles waltl]|uniref:Uncharacterized protein n=1 Tax=Pleurodeles waltl TaxID=8319 RepID=A0AAV7UXD8_PLEWA|nr:hypothetical protein NDU88_003055 [Pleurodeles waltl]
MQELPVLEEDLPGDIEESVVVEPLEKEEVWLSEEQGPSLKLNQYSSRSGEVVILTAFLTQWSEISKNLEWARPSSHSISKWKERQTPIDSITSGSLNIATVRRRPRALPLPELSNDSDEQQEGPSTPSATGRRSQMQEVRCHQTTQDGDRFLGTAA